MSKRIWWWLRISAVAALIIVGLAAAYVLHGLNDHPSLDEYARYELAPPARAEGRQVRVTFLGVATLLIDDGETALMTDGFFTRPAKTATFLGTVAPDRELIAATLRRAGVDKLAAVMVVHSHYDHAMDSPEVARLTGAVVVGSTSTANIARGWQLPEAQIKIVDPSTAMHFGAFTVTMVPSRHFPHGIAMGEIEAPLVPPVRATDYREGGSYSVFIEHPLGTLLVQGSAGWVEGALAGRHADVAMLGMGALGTKDEAYHDTYYREIVDAVGAKCVIPIHWDDFTLPLDQPLRAMPNLLDDVDASLRFLSARTTQRRVGLGFLPLWKSIPVFGAGAVSCQVATSPG